MGRIEGLLIHGHLQLCEKLQTKRQNDIQTAKVRSGLDERQQRVLTGDGETSETRFVEILIFDRLDKAQVHRRRSAVCRLNE